MARKQFIPPTIEEVRAYIIARECWGVRAEEFIRYYSENNWRDKNNDPVKVWKLKVLYWQGLAERRGDKPQKCYCGKYGEYIGKDDSGQLYYRCSDHKPKHKHILPASMTANIGKPVPDGVNINNERNKQIAALLKGAKNEQGNSINSK